MDISQLDPKEFFVEFAKLLKIPRCSNNEEEIKKYFISIAKSLNLDYIENGAGNLLIIKSDGSKERFVTLQAHMDMVCVKGNTSTHNFKEDPIIPVIKGDLIYATDTTLGADNGAGLAYMVWTDGNI